MTDRKVSVNENDLRAALGWVPLADFDHAASRLRAALDALAPEPCGHPSQRIVADKWTAKDEPAFRCQAPKGHHTFVWEKADRCCREDRDDPIHCGDAHVPPESVWTEETP